MKIKQLIITATCAASFFTGIGTATAQQTTEQRVVALKTSLAKSQASLKSYAWIETTTVSFKGEVKSTKQMSCYYGADGTLQRVAVSASPPADKKPGLRGRVVANKTQELTAYMQSAVALVKTYVPLKATTIQAQKEAGKIKVDILPGGKSVRLNFPDYAMPGDNVGVELNLMSNQLMNFAVATYLDDPSDKVTMDVQMAQLNDGSSYASHITLNAAAKGIVVTVQNSGHQKK